MTKRKASDQNISNFFKKKTVEDDRQELTLSVLASNEITNKALFQADPANGSNTFESNEKPIQPKSGFQKKKFGKETRSFMSSWYANFPWLEYSITTHKAFCYNCRVFGIRERNTYSETAFN